MARIFKVNGFAALMLFGVSGCNSLPTLTLSPELLKDPLHYQVIGKEKISLRDLGHDLKATVRQAKLDHTMQPLNYHATYSEHLLVVADKQQLHVNKSSDTIMIPVDGHGYLEGVRKTAVVWEHEVMRIPKNTPYAFINAATDATVLYVMFSPPYDDRQVFGVKTRRDTFFVDESSPIGIPQQ